MRVKVSDEIGLFSATFGCSLTGMRARTVSLTGRSLSRKFMLKMHPAAIQSDIQLLRKVFLLLGIDETALDCFEHHVCSDDQLYREDV